MYQTVMTSSSWWRCPNRERKKNGVGDVDVEWRKPQQIRLDQSTLPWYILFLNTHTQHRTQSWYNTLHTTVQIGVCWGDFEGSRYCSLVPPVTFLIFTKGERLFNKKIVWPYYVVWMTKLFHELIIDEIKRRKKSPSPLYAEFYPLHVDGN